MQRILLLMAVVFTLVGCRKEEFDDGVSIEPQTDYIEVADVGGRCSINYTIKNPINGILPTLKSDAEWIVDVDNSQSGVVSFRVLVNDADMPREAVVELLYPSVEVNPRITIHQAGLAGEKLMVEVINIQYSECSVKITPQSEDMPYVVMMAEKSYFEGLGINDAESLVAADEAYFMGLCTAEESLEEFLTKSNLALRGTQTKRWQDLSPAKEYVVYAYGIYVNGESFDRATPIYHTIIESRLPEREVQNFDVTIVADDPEVNFTVVPESWEGYYMVQLVEDSEAGYVEQGMSFTEEAANAVAEAFFYVADHLYYFEEKSAEEIMQQLGYRGSVEFSRTLNANHRYMALIYAIDSADGDVPMVVSKPIVEYFSTGTVERSDMTFEVEFSNIRPRSLDVRIVPSKSDEMYNAVMMYRSNLPDGDKQEQLEYVMQKYAPLELMGVYEEHIDLLPPDTEFVIAVYGFYAGVATTDLFVYSFTTAKDGWGDNYITGVRCTAYDLAEVVALEPYYKSYVGYADYFLSIEVETSAAAPALHFDLFPKSVVEEYGLEAVRASLLEYSYTSSPDWALCSYGNEYVVCGLAEDDRGYVGEMFVSDSIVMLREDVGEASEFVELYAEYVTPNAASKSMIFR